MFEQAIFTSTTTAQAAGYQLTRASAGLTPVECQALAKISPTHESLTPGHYDFGSVNYWRLPTGRYCLSVTRIAGLDYSGRGESLETRLFVGGADVWERFGAQPFALVRAITAKGLLLPELTAQGPLGRFPLVGRAATWNKSAIELICQIFTPGELQGLLEELAANATVVLSNCAAVAGHLGPRPAEICVQTLFNILPPQLRAELTFSAGLRLSLARRLRILAWNQPDPAGLQSWPAGTTLVEFLPERGGWFKRAERRQCQPQPLWAEPRGWVRVLQSSVNPTDAQRNLAALCAAQAWTWESLHDAQPPAFAKRPRCQQSSCNSAELVFSP
ncbi:MAG: hypothetical protein SFX18_15780 [Pirellulales bacterium]|nr:hypothetical protein [Pirellulales bacterium]